MSCVVGGSEHLRELFKEVPEDKVRIATTSFGATVVCYMGGDDRVHTVIPTDELGYLLREWEHGPGYMISHQRFIEIANLVSTVRGQMMSTMRSFDRRVSDVFEGSNRAMERSLSGLKFEVDGFKLSDEQINAIKVILGDPRPVCVLTGQAGAGKSAVIKWLQEAQLATVCATTGRAAINVGGVTVDSLFCFSRDTYSVFKTEILEVFMKKSHKVIVIDEASMVGFKMATLLITLAERYEKKLVLVGDWAQAMPVQDDWGHKSRMFDDCAFVRLEESHRQDEKEFLEVLNKVRVGVVDTQVDRVLSSRAMPPPEEHGWVRMYATNRMADEFNKQQLERLCREYCLQKFIVRAKFHDMRDATRKDYKPRNPQFKAKAIEESRFANESEFALESQVLITSNDVGKRYVNGDVGILVDIHLTVDVKKAESEYDGSGPDIEWKPAVSFASLGVAQQAVYAKMLQGFSGAVTLSSITVELDRTGATVDVQPHTASFKSGAGNLQHTVTGFPIRLGYALTVHKTQGMTVEKAWLDMESIRAMPVGSRHGLAYVGLSRVKTLGGLGIGSWAPDVVVCDNEVLNWI